jgi:hypothetical protein
MLSIIGCGQPAANDDQPWSIDTSKFKPVSGKITIKGKPYAKVVVAFFSSKGIPSSGETDADGNYTIQTMGTAGAPPGDYKVALSYFLAPDGSAQGMGSRSAMVQSDKMIAARETLPAEYADVNKTSLRASISGEGGKFDFDIDADPKPPVAEPKKTDEPKKDAAKVEASKPEAPKAKVEDKKPAEKK